MESYVTYTPIELRAIAKLRRDNHLVDGHTARIVYEGEKFLKRELPETIIAVFDVNGLMREITLPEYLGDPVNEAPAQAVSSILAPA